MSWFMRRSSIAMGVSSSFSLLSWPREPRLDDVEPGGAGISGGAADALDVDARRAACCDVGGDGASDDDSLTRMVDADSEEKRMPSALDGDSGGDDAAVDAAESRSFPCICGCWCVSCELRGDGCWFSCSSSGSSSTGEACGAASCSPKRTVHIAISSGGLSCGVYRELMEWAGAFPVMDDVCDAGD